MEILDRETLLTLARHFGWPSVSIYLPTHRVPTKTEHDMLVLKNLVRSAHEQLVEGGMRVGEADALLSPAYASVTDSTAWREPADGRAFFLAQDTFYSFRTDIALPECAVVGERFQIRPLLPAVDAAKRFYVLALSKKHMRLLEGSSEGLHEVEVEGAPMSLAEATNYDDFERNVQFHSRTPAASPTGGRRAAVFHGHGGTPDVAKENLQSYFRQVDRGVHELLRDDDAPLLLAGVEYLLPIYRAQNSYPHLAAESLTGSPDELTDSEIHKRAILALGPHFDERLDRDKSELERLTGTEASSADLSEILPAAVDGRIRVLFVSDREAEWGWFDPSNGHVELHEPAESGDSDLTDLATVETLLRGGIVHALPDRVQTSAIFRY